MVHLFLIVYFKDRKRNRDTRTKMSGIVHTEGVILLVFSRIDTAVSLLDFVLIDIDTYVATFLNAKDRQIDKSFDR
jgi:hypothetical protein